MLDFIIRTTSWSGNQKDFKSLAIIIYYYYIVICLIINI
jgi:hypothetical protein